MTNEKKWEVPDMALGEVAADFHQDNVRVRILRGPKSMCAYFGVPISHPLAGCSSDDIPLDVHGGLSLACVGDGGEFPRGWFWYGWDYSHGGDARIPGTRANLARVVLDDDAEYGGKQWTVAEVLEQAREALPEFLKLMRLAERAAANARGDKP